MSTLISSAVGGKKAAAPKGAVRRRPPQPLPSPGAPAKAATPISVSSAQTSIAPPSPPHTQPPTTTAPSEVVEPRAPSPRQTPTSLAALLQSTEQPGPAPPTGIESSSRTLNTTRSASQVLETPSEVAPQPAPSKKRKRDAPPPKETPQAAREKTQPAKKARVSKTVASASTPIRAEQSAAPQNVEAPQTAAPAADRKRDAAPAKETAQPAKRVKRSSARSNNSVQTAIREDVPTETVMSTASVQKAGRGTRSKAARPVEPAVALTTAPVDAPAVAKAPAKRTTTVTRRKTGEKQTETTNVETVGPVEKATATTKKASAKRKSKSKSAATVLNSDDENETTTAETLPELPARKAAPKRKTRARKTQPAQDDAPTGPTEENSAEEAEDDGDESDPELHEIDPNTVTMYEIGGDKRHGKTSEREKKMAEIDWTEVARKRREAEDHALAPPVQQQQRAPTGTVVESTEGPSGTAETPSTAQEKEIAAAATTESTQPPEPMFIVDPQGQIIENPSTLLIDRRALAEAEATTLDPVEEDLDLTVRINRTTHINARRRDVADRVPMHRGKSEPWSEVETERFYTALRMFGTDFQTISRMFPPKTRRMIKAKFNREERLDPKRVTKALVGEKEAMDLVFYAKEVGREVEEFRKFEGLEQAERVIKEGMREREEELRRAVGEEKERAEAVRREVVARGGAGGAEEEAAAGGKKKRVVKGKEGGGGAAAAAGTGKKTTAKKKGKKGAETSATGADGGEVVLGAGDGDEVE